MNAGRVSRAALDGNKVMMSVPGMESKGSTVSELIGDSVCVDVVVRRLCRLAVCSVADTEELDDVSDSPLELPRSQIPLQRR